MKTHKFNVACINQCTEAEGPGKRLAIWFQGCDKRCDGCCNPELLDFKQAHILTLEMLVEIINNAKKQFNIEGVSFLGGEPALQQGLAELSLEIKKNGLGVILLTGKKIEDLDGKLRTSVDMIIDGGFEKDKPDNERNLVGSTNQKLFFISERYRPFEEWFYIPRPKRVEINISGDQGLLFTGDKII